MKKYAWVAIGLVLVICIGLLCGAAVLYKKSKAVPVSADDAEIINKYAPGWEFSFEDGAVPDEKTAIEIAKAVWAPIYGEENSEVYTEYIAEYDEEYDVWLVQRVLPANYLGGVPYALIQKQDGKVLTVWHTK